MLHQTYTIYFDGKIADNFNPEEVKKRAQTVFKLSDENTEIFFNGDGHVLKEELSQHDCEQYLDQLLNFGLIGKTEPLLPITEKTVDSAIAKKQPKHFKHKTTLKYLFLFICLTVVGATVAWHYGLLQTPQKRITINDAMTSTHPLPETAPINNRIDSQNTINSTIEACTDSTTTNKLEVILKEGIFQSQQDPLATINLILKNYSDNQEIYFDAERNKRLCGVLAQYKIEGEGLSQEVNIVYEIIYEIQKEEDQTVNLTIFRQRIIPPTPPSGNATNEEELEQD